LQTDSCGVIVSDVPSNGDTQPTASQIIDEFDTNDIIFDQEALEEV
jgi:hypothetical protein